MGNNTEMPQLQEASKRRISSSMVIFVLALVCLALIYFSPPTPAPREVIPVKAGSYVWPEGCEQKRYKIYDEISSVCMDERYKLSDEFSRSQGIATKDRNSSWHNYRLGNDAVRITKKFGTKKWRDVFEIKELNSDVFYQEK